MNTPNAASSFDESELAYQDCVVKSGIPPEIYHLNFEPASGIPVYDGLFRDSDKTTNSGSSLEAARNLARCTGDAGYFYKNKFWLLSDLCGASKDAINGNIKSKGIFRPEGQPAAGWICSNGRFRQLAGAPIALDDEGQARRYHQATGKPLEVFCPKVTVAVWREIAAKHNLPMPEFPAVGIGGEALEFWDWVVASGCPTVITEGEKKACCLIGRGYAALGLPGINTGYRVTEYGEEITKLDGTTYRKAIARELCEVLQALDTRERVITILFDFRAGDYSQSQEFKAASTTAKLFKNARAFIAQLPGPNKGVDDFAVAGGDVDAVVAAARSINEIQKESLKGFRKEIRKKAWALTHPAAWECNQRYLDIPYHAGLVGVKSPKGTGKTYDLIKLIAQTHAQGRKVLLLTHRIVLGRAICKAVGIPWIEEMNSDADRFTEGKAMGFGLCVDSLHPLSQAAFNPLDWEGALVIIDEAEQVFWHALNASTCRENRQAILSTMRTLFQSVLSTDGTVRLQDADLSDISIDFVRELSAMDIKPWIAVNHWQPSEPWKIKFYDTQHVKGGTKDDPSGLLKDSVDHVRDGGKIWVTCDSQKAKSKHGTKTLEKYYRSRCPGKKILRIDAETVANPEHPAYQCAEKIQGSEKIKDGLAALYDIIICSPSLATGVSVDLRGHFTAVFGIFQGAISDNEVRQSLARVREPVPRFVWCRQIAVSKIGNGESNYKEVAKSKEKDCRYNLQLLRDIDFDLDKAHNPVVLRYWAKYAARINSSIWDFRETVREGLEAEGHIITDCGDDDRDTAGEIKTLRITGFVEEAVAVAEAEDIDRSEFEKLSQQRSKTDAERYKEEKFRLKEIYKVDKVTPTLRQLHQDRWFGKIILEYLLTHNPDFIWMRDRKKIDSQIKNGDGQLCLQDVQQVTAKLKIHELLNTLQFTDRTKEWSNKSPEVLEFASKALKLAADIKDVTGIKVTQEKVAFNPIGVVGSFVAQLGRSPKLSQQRRIGEERVRFYRFDTAASFNCFDGAGNKLPEPEGLRAQIFEAWVQRDELALFEFQLQGIAAVEADVTLQAKSARSQVSSDLTSKSGSVTPPSINKEEISSVTTSPTVETPKEQEKGSGSATEKVWAWYQVKKEWIKCRVLGFVGDCYRLEVKSMVDDGLAIFKAFPEDLRWEAPT
jgi:hypothetical protein